MGDIDFLQVDERSATEFITNVERYFPEAQAFVQQQYTTRSGRASVMPSQYSDYVMGGKKIQKGGVNNCSIYFKFLLRTTFTLILLSSASLFVAGAVVGAEKIGMDRAQVMLNTVYQFCSTPVFNMTPIKATLCGFITKIQQELLAILANTDFNTIKTILTALTAATTASSFWQTLKNGYSALSSLVDRMTDDLCETFFSQRAIQTASIGTQTVAIASVAADAAAGHPPGAAPGVTGPLDSFVTRGRRGGRKHRRSKRTVKAKRPAKGSTRKMLFRY